MGLEANRLFNQVYPKLLELDYYGRKNVVGGLQSVFGKKMRRTVYLNTASIASISPSTTKSIDHFHSLQNTGKITPEKESLIFSLARRHAAALLQVPEPDHIALFRNTTDALSIAIFLSGVLSDFSSRRSVLTGNGENPATVRAIRILADHSNPQKDLRQMTTFDPRSAQPEYASPEPRLTEVGQHFFNVRGNDLQQMKKEIKDLIKQHDPHLFLLSHVLRHNGQLLPIKELVAFARSQQALYHPNSPPIVVCIDGAEALGNLPQIDAPGLDCDFYVACAHKALTGLPLGLLYMRPSADIRQQLRLLQNQHQQVATVLDGMFASTWNIPATSFDSLSTQNAYVFCRVCNALRKLNFLRQRDGFLNLDEQRRELKTHLICKLAQLSTETGVPIASPPIDQPTNFIHSFRIGPAGPTVPDDRLGLEFLLPEEFAKAGIRKQSLGRTIAELLNKRGVALTYLRRDNLFRVSFSQHNTQKDIDDFIVVLREVLSVVNQRIAWYRHLKWLDVFHLFDHYSIPL